MGFEMEHPKEGHPRHRFFDIESIRDVSLQMRVRPFEPNNVTAPISPLRIDLWPMGRSRGWHRGRVNALLRGRRLLGFTLEWDAAVKRQKRSPKRTNSHGTKWVPP